MGCWCPGTETDKKKEQAGSTRGFRCEGYRCNNVSVGPPVPSCPSNWLLRWERTTDGCLFLFSIVTMPEKGGPLGLTTRGSSGVLSKWLRPVTWLARVCFPVGVLRSRNAYGAVLRRSLDVHQSFFSFLFSRFSDTGRGYGPWLCFAEVRVRVHETAYCFFQAGRIGVLWMRIVHGGEGADTKVVGAMKYVGDLARYTLARVWTVDLACLITRSESLMGRRFGITRSWVFFKGS